MSRLRSSSWGVEREGKSDRHADVFDEPTETREPADGRDGCAAVGDSEIGQPSCGRQDVVEVHHRLAHSHEHRVIHRLPPPEMEGLIQDLGGAQVPAEAHRPCRAEGAGERTARLRGQAEGPSAVPIPHQNRLDGMPVARTEERLRRAVTRDDLLL
jgi:hypothetical protein